MRSLLPLVLAVTALAQPRQYRSHVTVFDLATRTSRVLYSGDGIIEAPNWSRDGSHLLVNTGGGLYRLPTSGEAKLERVNVGNEYRCNNDHDYSKDGRRIAFSASTPDVKQSRVFVANADGSNPRLVTPQAPSYFHGWSPDGKWLGFVAARQPGKFELYRVAAEGGEEQQLTTAGGYDDGPEYSPDGKWIYFNSNRSGAWEVWRMPASGAGPVDKLAQRLTNDTPEDWFPHLSPDGKHAIFIAFPAGTKGHGDRMPGMTLRYIKNPGAKKWNTPETLATFYGGQGTINVNSWSPDSKRFAYVAYEPVDQVTWRFDKLEQIGGHATTIEGAPKLIDNAIQFNGDKDAIFLETHPLAGAEKFTWEVIFRPDADGRPEQRFFHMQENGSQHRLLFETRLIDGQWCLDSFAATSAGSQTLIDPNYTRWGSGITWRWSMTAPSSAIT
jgi:TolB protein